MGDIIPKNLEPIQDVIDRVRLLNKPNYKDKDCGELEKRFWDQDWKTQLDIYELWLDIDNDYSRTCLYRVLNQEYWELLQELVALGVEKAAALSTRIMEHSIKHMRTQIIAFFVTENASIEIVRKYKKQLALSLDVAYNALALRIGGDKDFEINKDRLYNRLEYFDICAKFNLPSSDQEAIDELKLYFKYYGRSLWCDTIDETCSILDIHFSLRLNRDIDNWRKAIESLGLNRAVKAFDNWDSTIQSRVNTLYQAYNQNVDTPFINHDRLDYFWRLLIDMAISDLSFSLSSDEYLNHLVTKNPELGKFINTLDLKLVKPLEL